MICNEFYYRHMIIHQHHEIKENNPFFVFKRKPFFQDFVKTENTRASQPKYFVLTNITHFIEHKFSWKMSYIFVMHMV